MKIDATNKVKMLVIDAMFLSIITLMTFVPYIGFITINPTISFTIIHIPVLIGAYLFGYKRGLLYGFFFGLMSLLKALTMPSGSLDYLFIYPWISILPRLLFGLAAGLIFSLIKKMKNKGGRITTMAVASFALTILHTLLVVGSLVLFFPEKILSDSDASTPLFATLFSLIAIGAVIEAALASVVMLAFSPLFERTEIITKKTKSFSLDETESDYIN